MPDQSPDFKKCLQRGGLTRIDSDPRIVAKEMLVACQDLSEGEASIERGSFKWATVQAYYAMFHIAKALVYQSGYREKSHRCLAIALRELYVRPGRLDEAVLRELRRNRGLKGYRLKQAHQFALNRRKKARHRIEASTWILIEALICQEWSPEQVSDWLKDNYGLQISHEWICQYTLNDKHAGGDLHRHL